MFNSNRLFPSTLNFCTLELGYFIITPENKYGNNLIYLKNYFKDYNYQFLPLQLESQMYTVINTILAVYLLNFLIV